MSMANSAESMASSADRAPGRPRRRTVRLGVAAACLALIATATPWSIAAAGASPSMDSTGSSFAGVAIQNWVAQTNTLFGLNINWQVQSSVVRPPVLRAEPGRLRRIGHPLQRRTDLLLPEHSLPVHARRGRGAGVHVQPQRERRPTDHEPQSRRGRDRRHLPRQDHQVERPGHRLPQSGSLPGPAQPDHHPGVPFGRLRGELPAVRLSAAPGRGHLHPGAEGLPVRKRRTALGDLAGPLGVGEHQPLHLPELGVGDAGRTVRLGQRRQLRLCRVERGVDHLPRDRLRPRAQVSGRVARRTRAVRRCSRRRSTSRPRWRPRSCTPT